jgi:vacuolar-type H+-ATPase subunit I/STV1
MTQVELTAVKKAASLIDEKQSTKDGSKDMLRMICQYLENTLLEVKGLQETLSKHERMIKEQSKMIPEQSTSIKELQAQLEATQSQNTEECKQLQKQIETVSYAGVVGNRPHHQQDAPLGPPGLPTFASTLFCTIDTSRVREEDKAKAQIADIRQRIEKEMRGSEQSKNWRCAAMIKDHKNADRVKVICRNEEEIQQIKEAAQKIDIPGLRVLRDQLYPVKIDNANRTAVLDADGNILQFLGPKSSVQHEVQSRRDAGSTTNVYSGVCRPTSNLKTAASEPRQYYSHLERSRELFLAIWNLR